MTIRHLLTMASGLDWNEDLPHADPANTCLQMEAAFDWVEFTIDRPMALEAGASFVYDSGVTPLLSRIFTVPTGEDVEEFVMRDLFAPLDINAWHWKPSPTGLANTEGGPYLRIEHIARIAEPFQRRCDWLGRQIVPAQWVAESIAPAVAVSDNGVKHGYKWWLQPCGENDARLVWSGSGIGGQLQMVFPDLRVVAVFLVWNILPGNPYLNRSAALRRAPALRSAD